MSSTQMDSIWPIGFQQKLSSNIWVWVGYTVCLWWLPVGSSLNQVRTLTECIDLRAIIGVGMSHVKIDQILVRLQFVFCPAVSLNVNTSKTGLATYQNNEIACSLFANPLKIKFCCQYTFISDLAYNKTGSLQIYKIYSLTAYSHFCTTYCCAVSYCMQ